MWIDLPTGYYRTITLESHWVAILQLLQFLIAYTLWRFIVPVAQTRCLRIFLFSYFAVIELGMHLHTPELLHIVILLGALASSASSEW